MVLEFIYPILILAAIALIFGVLLAFLGNKLAVKTDPKIEEARSHLAGANCGACGYAGCDAYAKALVEGKAKLEECSATSKESKDKIAAVLGVANDAKAEIVMVGCVGGKNCLNRFDYAGVTDCNAVAALSGGSKACSYGCFGLGNCVRVCPTGAMVIKEGVAQVMQDKCIQCGLCIAECPRKIIIKVPEKAATVVVCRSQDKGAAVKKICSKGCLACGLCAKICPQKAITMVKNLPIINYDICNSCGLCAEKCPAKTIIKN